MTEAEISRLSTLFGADDRIKDLAVSYLRKLNRRTNNSMGKADMLKYMACVDLAHRHYSIPLNQEIGNKHGLKSSMYPGVLRNIIKILEINKQLSFDELAQKFGCNHFKSRFQQLFEKYHAKKLASLPPVQRAYINLGSGVYRAACFQVATRKYSKVRVDLDKLCSVMCVEKKKVAIVIKDIELLCFAKKRSLSQMYCHETDATDMDSSNNDSKNEKEKSEDAENMENSMFQDDYETRKQRKQKQWKEKQLAMATRIRKNPNVMTSNVAKNRTGSASSRTKNKTQSRTTPLPAPQQQKVAQSEAKPKMPDEEFVGQMGKKTNEKDTDSKSDDMEEDFDVEGIENAKEQEKSESNVVSDQQGQTPSKPAEATRNDKIAKTGDKKKKKQVTLASMFKQMGKS